MLRLHPYEYHRPETVEGALALLAEHAGDAMPIAGGTDLVPNMKHRLFTPGHLVSLRRIPEMYGVGEEEGGVRIGSAETIDSIARHPLVRRRYPSLARACSLISGPQLRRVGTIGGNICLDTRCTYYNQTFFWRKALGFCLKKDGDVCHVVRGGTRCVAAHSADSPPVLMTVGAQLEIAGMETRRTIEVERFFTSDGVWNRRLGPDELVISVFLPAPKPGTRYAFEKLRIRESIDFPLLNLAVAAGLDEVGRVTDLAMVASGMGAYPRRVGQVQELAAGERLTPALIDQVAREAFRQCHPLDNIIVDGEWRRAMAPVLVRRALRRIADQT
jgi:4-hydroxybenzoyl-CoA reductase subunit beta